VSKPAYFPLTPRRAVAAAAEHTAVGMPAPTIAAALTSLLLLAGAAAACFAVSATLPRLARCGQSGSRRRAAWLPVAVAATAIAGLSATWWATSVTLVLLNRWVLSGGATRACSWPATFTAAHATIKGLAAVAVLLTTVTTLAPPRSDRSAATAPVPQHPGATGTGPAPSPHPPPAGAAVAEVGRCAAAWSAAVTQPGVSWRVAAVYLLPLGATTAADLWLSAVALS